MQQRRRRAIQQIAASFASMAFALASAFVFAAPSLLQSQDTRTVKEPTIPPTCTTLKAALTIAVATSGSVEATPGTPALDTRRIQSALDHCAKGSAVELAPGGPNNAFLTGPIALRAGVTLLVDQGVTLYGTRNPEFYAVTPGSCGIVNDDSHSGCEPLISARTASGSGIMGDGAIDGQGGAKLMVNGRPSSKSWWDLADDARTSGHQQAPRLIQTDLTDQFTLYRITLRNSPNVHVSFHRGDGLTVWGIRIDTPKTARNTDGIDPEQARNITVTQSFIRTGDDDIAIRAGDGRTSNVTVAHNHFYWGHGMSIGGETNGGVDAVRVEDLSLDGPDNGIRIRSSASHGGLVENVVYDDVCIRDSKYPILFDTAYTFPGKGVEMFPEYKDILLHDVRVSGGGRIEFNGFDHAHRIAVKLDGVLALDSPAKYKAEATHTDFIFGPGPVNFIFTGDDSTVSGKEVSGTLPSCAAKFVPFP